MARVIQRTGRALIHIIMRRRGLAPRALPPVSLVPGACQRAVYDVESFEKRVALARTVSERLGRASQAYFRW